MRHAVIDLGTNTFNLLIGEVNNDRLERLYAEKIPVLLGMGGINQGLIDESAMTRAKLALRKFKTLCDDFQVKAITGIGTSALRAAKNRSELVTFADVELGISIDIISGEQEAELIFEGVSWSYPIESKVMIMDIGGGSTEFITADKCGIENIASLDIGVSRIFQSLNQPKTFSSEHVNEIYHFLDTHGNHFFSEINATTLIGSSGSFETLYEMIFKSEFGKGNDSKEIPLNRVLEEINWLINSSLDDRMANEWIVPIRKRMMPIAAIQLKWVIERLKIDSIFVSPYSLKEGVFSKGLLS